MATTITANGINFPDGSAGSPSIGGTDTNTGLFTGSDVVGFATGGSERLRIDASGNVNIANDSGKLQLGTGADLQSWHNGTHSLIKNNTGRLYVLSDDVWFKDKDDGDLHAKFVHDGAVELYYNNSKKLETYSGGVRLDGELLMQNNSVYLNDAAKLRIGTGQDLEIYHDSTHSYLSNGTGNLFVEIPDGQKFQVQHGSEAIINGYADGRVELYYDNSKKLETVNGGVYVYGDLVAGVGGSGNFSIGDGQKIIAGSGNDLQIYHSSNISYIDDLVGAGDGVTIRAKNIRLQSNANIGAKSALNCVANGAVELFHNDVKTCETTRSGISLPKGVIHGVGNGSMAMIGGTINPSQDTTWNFPFNTNHAGTNNGYFFYVRVFMNHWNTGNYYKILEKYIGGRGNTTGYNAVTPLENNGSGGSSWSNGHFDCSVVLSGDGVQPATFKVTYDADGSPSWTSGYHICVQHSSILGPPTIT